MSLVVSIVGRPNVGKSTLFNRIIEERRAIVDDEAGVTRDRHYGEAFWNGIDFTLIDTGGYVPEATDQITEGIREQVHLAVEESDVILMMVDTASGIHSIDEIIVRMLREQSKPVLLVANKSDNEQRRLEAFEFYALGMDEVIPISSITGMGTGELLDRVVENLPSKDGQERTQYPGLAVIGRPNVGKSSYVNALLKSERCIVTDIPGTTRDSINSMLEYKGKTYELIDTAGLRKKAKVREAIEFYSTVRTERAVRACDVAIIMIDAMQGFEEQDKRIVRLAEEFNKGMVIALNKWDTVPDKHTNLVKEFQEYVYERLPHMRYIPIVTTSATSGQRIYKVLDKADQVLEERKKRIATSELVPFLHRILKERPLPMKRGKTLKIHYITQVKSNPPVFKFFMNQPADLPANYRRFLENKIREEFGFQGVPITMRFQQK